MGLNIKGIIKCALAGMAVTAVILVILSLLEYFTKISGSVVSALAYGALIAGALMGGVLATISAEGKIIWHVLSVCGIYIAVLAAVSVAVNGALIFNAHSAAVIGGIVLASLLGMAVAGKRN